jgi:hypothetical protein
MLCCVPDDVDYEWLTQLLANPEVWSDKDVRAVAFLMQQNQGSLAEIPAHHFRARRTLEHSIRELQEALDRYEASRG